MAATTVATLIQRTRRQLRDWPDQDTITASVTAGATTVLVADTTRYYVNERIELDYETMVVRALTNATTLTVERGALGSTAATHLSAAPILLNPRFYSVEIVDALADGVDAAFPYIYKPVVDTSLTATDSTYEYTIPSGTNGALPYVWKVETQESGELTPWKVRNWMVFRGATPKLKFRISQPASATIRIHAYDWFPRLTSAGSLDTLWPQQLEFPLVMFACATLLASGEFSRVAIDRGVIDEREQANRPGASMAASQFGLQWYLRRVMTSGYPPMSKHVRPVT